MEELKFLSIIKDGMPTDMQLGEIFDNKKYTNIKIVTFVSSATFMCKALKNFRNIDLIIGIDDDNNKQALELNIAKYFDINNRKTFYNLLDETLKEKLCIGVLRIYYSLKNIIHDKIYLLENLENSDTRVIIGSANLSNNAFANEKQFESIEIFDNDKNRFDYYTNRFHELQNLCVDYVPERMRKLPEKVDSNDINALSIIKTDENFDMLMDLVENSREMRIMIDDSITADLNDYQKETVYQKEEVETNVKRLNLLFKRNPKGGLVPKTKKELEKIKVSIKTTINSKAITATEDMRVFYKYDERLASLFIEQHTSDESNKSVYITYPLEIDKGKLKDKIEVINKIVNSYKDFSTYQNIDNRHKIFEIILYAFISPFLWKAREQYVTARGTETERRYIYPFMIIGGSQESGKSTILDLVGRLIGNNAPYFGAYNNYSKSNNLLSLFYTENICPLLIDEINLNFFTSKREQLGEALIKRITNDCSGQHPCLIGTTNMGEFHVSGQVLSRIIYIELNNFFDKERRLEARDFLEQIRDTIDDELFRDFCYKIIGMIKENKEIYSQPDILSVAREIFRNYYEDCGVEVPEWLDFKEHFDYQNRGRETWLNWYANNKSSFRENKDSMLYINTNDIWGNNKEVEKFINYLDKDSIASYSAPMLLLNKTPFYKYIGLKKSGLARIREILF
jgi:hypothetical protein